MRKLKAILLAGLVAGFSVFVTMMLTFDGSQRRSVVLLVVTLATTTTVATYARRWHGAAAFTTILAFALLLWRRPRPKKVAAAELPYRSAQSSDELRDDARAVRAAAALAIAALGIAPLLAWFTG